MRAKGVRRVGTANKRNGFTRRRKKDGLKRRRKRNGFWRRLTKKLGLRA